MFRKIGDEEYMPDQVLLGRFQTCNSICSYLLNWKKATLHNNEIYTAENRLYNGIRSIYPAQLTKLRETIQLIVSVTTRVLLES